MNNEEVISLIKLYYKKLKPPGFGFGKAYELYFLQYSYSKWAYQEALNAIRKNMHVPAYISLDALKNDMAGYSLVSEKESIMFSIGEDVVQSIIDSIMYHL